RQANLPVVGDQRPELVAGLPFDFVLLDAVEDLLVGIEADAVRGTRLRALTANLAEIFDAEVDRLAWRKWQVGHDRIAQMDACPEFLCNDQSVATELADSTGECRGLRIYFAAQRGVTKLLDISLQ